MSSHVNSLGVFVLVTAAMALPPVLAFRRREREFESRRGRHLLTHRITHHRAGRVTATADVKLKKHRTAEAE